jgi:type IV secretion system protein VirB10
MWRPIVCCGFTLALFAQTIDEVTVRRKTEIFITLERSLSTRTAQAGDKFYGTVAVPVTLDDRIIIPVGSYIIGQVDASRKPGRVKGAGEIGLKFDTVILPDGTTRQIAAVVGSAEGYESGRPNEEGKIKAEGDQGEATAKGALGGGVSGGAIGAMAGRSWKGAGVGAGVGAATGAIIGLLTRNKDVVLPKGASVTVVLENDVRFVKPASGSRGRTL